MKNIDKDNSIKGILNQLITEEYYSTISQKLKKKEDNTKKR
jgi:ribosomal protein S21